MDTPIYEGHREENLLDTDRTDFTDKAKEKSVRSVKSVSNVFKFEHSVV